jgi:hypothetical protein
MTMNNWIGCGGRQRGMVKQGGMAVGDEVKWACAPDRGMGLLVAWLSMVELGGDAPLRAERGGWWRG